jgi:hypothetical protein
MAQSIENKIKNRIYGKRRGWVFTPNSFADLGSAAAIRKSLSRLEKEGFIRRLAQGLYDYPEEHKTLGLLPPNIENVGKAIAEKYSIAIQPSGAYAANLLGLSEQVPAKIVFLTDGASKKITIGNLEITFKKTTPKNMKTAGTISGLVIQALKYIGQDHVTDEVINKLKLHLNSENNRRLQLDKSLAPIWIRKIIEEITEIEK